MNDLNHPKVKPFTTEIAVSLSLDPKFVEFVFAEARPDCFDYWVEDVDRGWTCYVPEKFDVAYPLWCTNADQTVILATDTMLAFGKGWHDNPNMEVISETTQGLLTYLMFQIAETDVPDNELAQAAKFCSYRYIDELIEFIDGPIPDDTSWNEAMAQFIADVDSKSR